MAIDATEFRKLFPDIAKHCDQSALETLLNAMTEQRVKAGQVVIREGEKSDALYFVGQGELTTSLEGNGEVVKIGSVNVGNSFCKVSLLDPGPAPMTVTANTDAVLLVLSQEAFRELEKQDLKMTGNLLRMLSDELIELCRNADRILFTRFSGVSDDHAHDKDPGLKAWAARVYKKLHSDTEGRV